MSKIMKAKVLGVQTVNYTKKTGEPCSGVTLHVCFKDNQVRGEAVDSPFVNDNLGIRSTLDVLQPGQLIDIEYNRRGFVGGITVCK